MSVMSIKCFPLAVYSVTFSSSVTQTPGSSGDVLIRRRSELLSFDGAALASQAELASRVSVLGRCMSVNRLSR